MADVERAKPFVAWVTPECVAGRGKQGHLAPYALHADKKGRYEVPVVVTPLLPDDPRPGETWVIGPFSEHEGETVKILTPPFGHGLVMVSTKREAWTSFHVSRLRRPPVLKTFCLDMLNAGAETKYGVSATIRAESKEAALAKLAESLEEVR